MLLHYSCRCVNKKSNDCVGSSTRVFPSPSSSLITCCVNLAQFQARGQLIFNRDMRECMWLHNTVLSSCKKLCLFSLSDVRWSSEMRRKRPHSGVWVILVQCKFMFKLHLTFPLFPGWRNGISLTLTNKKTIYRLLLYICFGLFLYIYVLFLYM